MVPGEWPAPGGCSALTPEAEDVSGFLFVEQSGGHGGVLLQKEEWEDV